MGDDIEQEGVVDEARNRIEEELRAASHRREIDRLRRGAETLATGNTIEGRNTIIDGVKYAIVRGGLSRRQRRAIVSRVRKKYGKEKRKVGGQQ